MARIQEGYRDKFNSSQAKVYYCQKILTDLTDEQQVLDKIRETHGRAHRRIQENRKQILQKFYFANISEKLGNFIKVCDICNRTKYDRHPLVNKLQETPIPQGPYDILHVDIFSIENQYFLTSVDKFSKYAKIIPIESKNTTHVEPAFWTILTFFVIPTSICMDNEAAFSSPPIRRRLMDLGVQIYLTPSHHSECNEMVERLHSTVIELYRIYKNLNPELTVKERIILITEKYNRTIHSSTNKTPREILFPSNTDGTPVSPDELEEIRNRIYDEVLLKLKEARQKQNDSHNVNRNTPPELAPGKEVYIKDKLIKAKHKERFKKRKIQEDNRVTFKDDINRKQHKDNVKNVNLK